MPPGVVHINEHQMNTTYDMWMTANSPRRINTSPWARTTRSQPPGGSPGGPQSRGGAGEAGHGPGPVRPNWGLRPNCPQLETDTREPILAVGSKVGRSSGSGELGSLAEPTCSAEPPPLARNPRGYPPGFLGRYPASTASDSYKYRV